jgi:hypothetical protein
VAGSRSFRLPRDLVWMFPEDYHPGMVRVHGLDVIYASVDQPMLAHRPV